MEKLKPEVEVEGGLIWPVLEVEVEHCLLFKMHKFLFPGDWGCWRWWPCDAFLLLFRLLSDWFSSWVTRLRAMSLS